MQTAHDLNHPEGCTGIECSGEHPDLVHREVPTTWLAPASDPGMGCSFSYLRHDEIVDGAQVVHPSSGLVTYGRTTVLWTPEELVAVGRAHLELAWRLRRMDWRSALTSGRRRAA